MNKLTHILMWGEMKEATPQHPQPCGQYFTIEWGRLERVLRGEGPVLLAEHERIGGVEATERGLRICIVNEDDVPSKE